MKLLYIGADDFQQSIQEALSYTRNDHEILVATCKDDFIGTLERGIASVVLFDCVCPANLSLQQTILYARAFKVPVVALASVATETLQELQSESIGGYVFREHISQLPFVISGMVEKARLDKEMHELRLRLDRNAQFYQTLLKHIDDFVFLFDEKGELVYLSPAAHQITGFRGIGGKQLFEYIHPEDRKQFFHLFKKVLKKPGIRTEAHFRILHKAGHYIWIQGSITNLIKNDAIEAFVLSCQDVTERTEAERTMLRLNRLYDSIRYINRAILSLKDERALFKELCQVATEYGNFKMAYISIVDPSTGKLRLVRSSGVGEQDVEPSMVISGLEYHPFDSVLRTGVCYVCNDVDAEPDAIYWKYVANQKGFNSFVILPVCKAGKTVGVFVLAAAGSDAFTTKEIELLEETVDDISFKLDVLKKERMQTV